jgi:hypothetical protein
MITTADSPRLAHPFATPSRRLGGALRLAAAGGIAWNLFGSWQFAASFGATPDILMARGMSEAQAALYAALPAWMDLVFALGVFGGLIGSIALAARRRVALPVLAVSLVAYVLLFGGDAAYGVFDAIPGQLAVLSAVVAIAAALGAAAVFARHRGWLR